MPGFNRTGPLGKGAGTGRGAGPCEGNARDGVSVIVIRFILANWRPILAFLMTTLLPLASKKLLASRDDKTPELTILHPEKDSKRC